MNTALDVDSTICVRAFRSSCPFCTYFASTSGPKPAPLPEGSFYWNRLAMYLGEHIMLVHSEMLPENHQ